MTPASLREDVAEMVVKSLRDQLTASYAREEALRSALVTAWWGAICLLAMGIALGYAIWGRA